MLCLFLSLAGATEQVRIGDPSPDAVFAALEQELTDNLESLTLEDAPEIYHLRYHLLDMDAVSVEASLGSLIRTDISPFASLGVEVRVGEPAYDNTGFGGWQNGFRRINLPDVNTDYSTRLAAWRITDVAYKEAVEQYARKRAQFTAPETYPGDYTLAEPSQSVKDPLTVGDASALTEMARRLSATLATSALPLEYGMVRLGHEAGSHTIIDSEGTRVRRPMGETTLRAYAHLRAPDGMLLTDQRLWTVRTPEDLPSESSLNAEIAAMRDGLTDLVAAVPLTEEYVGPVILEGTAATDLFRYLLVPQVEGTPSEVPFDSWFGELGDRNDPVRVGRRVLPEGWTVQEDPTATPTFPGSFTIDFEGTPARPVSLVESGIVKQLLMSRIPRRGIAGGTTGSARSAPGSRAEARIADLTVAAPQLSSDKKLHKRAMKIAASYDRDWVLVIRRLQEPCIRTVGASFSLFGGDEGPSLPPPVSAVKRYADGTEEPVRGLSFAGIQRFVLRDIVAAGAPVTGTYMAPIEGDFDSLGPTEGMPTRITAPTVLIGEVELVPAPGDPQDVPLLSMPVADP